jgi:peptidoglycan hydrolase-like protein with peptidoglycan-binding domain
MTPQRARLALALFLLLAAAIVHNALFRQSRPSLGAMVSEASALPRPRAPTTVLAEAAAPPAKASFDARAVRRARVELEGTASDVPAGPIIQPAPAAASIDTIRAVQRELRQRGYGALGSDGSMRPATRAAIMAFEYDHGLPLTGQPSEALLRRILFGGAVAAEPAAGKVRSADAQEMVRSVQQSLAALGYQPGPADGQLAADTIRAIREFEIDKGLVPKGRISAELLAQLAGPTAPKKPRR